MTTQARRDAPDAPTEAPTDAPIRDIPTARYDAVVIGAGPAGATAALALARAGRSVAIVERAEFPRRKVCGEFVSGTSAAVLDALGVGGPWRERAGPEVRRVAIFAGRGTVDAPMPRGEGYGRALGRDVLDAMLLERAREEGAIVRQPWRATALERLGDESALTIEARDGAERGAGRRTERLVAPVIVAAHGSWERGELPSHPARDDRPDALMGFKAHFRGGSLPRHTMPLLAFRGGYGGMVWADDGRLSISLCIRRDVLADLRGRHGGSAAEAVDMHVRLSCRGVREALEGAVLDGPWLGTGPIRPGIRDAHADDVFRIGNVAGECHPAIAEGISMAVQSAWLLARTLEGRDLRDRAAREAAGRLYAAAWREQFATRIRAADVIARVAMRADRLAPLCMPLLRAAPAALTLGARMSGKERAVAVGARTATARAS